MINMLAASLLMASVMAEPSPCDGVIDRARTLTAPEDQLTLLGGCLASPSNVWVHAPVVIEMARISNANNMYEDVVKYLDILELMIDGIHSDYASSIKTK